ncbi:DUF4193 family protein [uncultured Mycolicibacterium sp.]|uniref:DUF4193 family protein n=1 Tax=uncultured Mycolicibacterium sp. TaxID=2320817 RepID=UPI002606CC7F|nr:DUF4193 family protein [uncultured Mycolicibacterium sp.]
MSAIHTESRPWTTPVEELLLDTGREPDWTDEDDEEALFDLGAPDEVLDGELRVAVVPRKADEFTCSRCFLIHHISHLATSADGAPVCGDCAE